MRQMYRLSRAFQLENGMRSNQLFRNSSLLGYQIYGIARGGRVFSTIPAEANTNSSNSSQDSNQKKKAADDDDFLSRHGGKVALVAFSIAAGLVYTYYLSIQDRNSIEKAVDSYEMPIDPYELLDLRNANQIKGEQFSSLLQKFLEAEQLSKYSESKINGSTTPNEQDHSEINFNEKSKSSRKVVNIPCLTYEKFIEFIKTNQTTFHQNVSPYYPRLANVILLPYLLERIIQIQVTKDFVPLEKLPTKFPFMMYDILTPEEQEEIDEERENRKKGKIPILAKNKDLFRLYPDGFLSEGNDDLSRPPQGAISSHFVDIPVAYDYLFLLLTMLMQDQNFPINIQQRLSSLYELALSIQVLQSQETSFIPDSSSIISSDAKSDGIISRDVMLRLIYMLQLTGQFPAEKQVIETGVKWPVRLHKRKSPFDMVKVYEEQQKKGEIQEWSYRDFEKFLISNHNCLWGICYHERKHLIPKNEEGAADQNN